MKWAPQIVDLPYSKELQISIVKGMEVKSVFYGTTPDAWLREQLERLARSYAIHLNGIERRRRGGPARVK